MVELQSCTRATLAFDLAMIAANLDAVAIAARASGIRVLFAAKSFPHPRVLELAAEKLDGFDVASQGEIAMVPTDKIISICDPSARAMTTVSGARTIVSIESAEQLAAVPGRAVEIAIRISASITGRDPAVGAILDGNGHRRSRFGLDNRAEVAALVEACGRRVGLHLHHGPITATAPERFIASAQAALAMIDFEPAFLNLGGAWHGIADLSGALAKIREAVPRSIELLIEPGRVFSSRAGFACGIVTAARSLSDRELRVLDLSRACHLRWSPVELVAPAPHPGRGRKVLLVGPTCYEEDTIGEWTIDPDQVERRAILKDVSGYALAWNTGFGGVPPADVIVR